MTIPTETTSLAARLLASALQSAANGFDVLPCHSPIFTEGKLISCSCGKPAADPDPDKVCDSIGKHPRTFNGSKDATKDEAKIQAWWAKWPEANIGLCVPPGWVVIDVDPRNGGEESLAALEARFGPLPETVFALTGGSGFHFVYSITPGTKLHKPGGAFPGIDLKTEGGYIIGEPSVHKSGRTYAWVTTHRPGNFAVAPLPPALLTFFAEGEKKPGAAPPIPDKISEGERHDHLLSLAGSWRRRGMNAEEILAGLRAVNEGGRVVPPLPDSEVADLASDAAARWNPAEDPDGKSQKQSEVLVGLAAEADLFHFEDEAFATFETNGHFETWPIHSKRVRLWLKGLFYNQCGKPPGNQAIEEAVGVLESKALFDGAERKVGLRIMEDAGKVYLDLGSKDWAVVEIDAQDWRVVERPEVRFMRPRSMRPLPRPERGGKVEELREFLNVADDSMFKLLVLWLLGAFSPQGPYVVLDVGGEQGSGKTTNVRVLRECVDPNMAPTRSAPRTEDDLIVATRSSRIVTLDNQSGVQPWLSDALARISTGAGISKRTLYSDLEETIFYGSRPVLMNGIEGTAARADLRDRCIRVVLPPISESKRLDEKTFWERFNAALPRILGSLLNAVSTALRNWETTKLSSLPRMADAARWFAAGVPAFGWTAEEVISLYVENRGEAVEDAVEGDRFAQMVELVAEEGFEGTATKLLERLNTEVENAGGKPDKWPKDGTRLAGRLRRVAPLLRPSGVEISIPTKKDRPRLYRLRNTQHSSVGSDAASLPVAAGSDAEPDAGDAGPSVASAWWDTRDAGDARKRTVPSGGCE